MSFSDALLRLRAASTRPQMGMEPGRANVSQQDLSALIAEFDHLKDAKARVEYASELKLCVDCNQLHPLIDFDPASPDFPTRDGLQYCCRKSCEGKAGYVRTPAGRVEFAE